MNGRSDSGSQLKLRIRYFNLFNHNALNATPGGSRGEIGRENELIDLRMKIVKNGKIAKLTVLQAASGGQREYGSISLPLSCKTVRFVQRERVERPSERRGREN